MFDFMIKFVFGVGCATVGVLLWLLICWLWDVIKDFYFNHIHKDTFRVRYTIRMSNIINDKNMPIYVRVSGIEPMERYVKAKNEYEAVARVMEMFREGHRMVVLDVDRVIGW